VKAAAHGKKRKIRKTGRHTAPSPARKVARRAGQAAPAVAVAGALTATLLHQSASTASAAGGQPAGSHAAYPDQILDATTANPQWLREDNLRSRQAATGASHSARPKAHSARPKAARPKAVHHSVPVAVAAQPAASSQPQTLACSVTGDSAGMLPANYAEIVDFLAAHGYTPIAAAGVAGNIYQESRGNPESVGTGGGGLIGWTPLPAGFVTGNPAADLETQLEALLTYNQQWAQYIPALNAATDAADAAAVYMDDFERPGIPAAANREGAATAVAQACGL
jgi:Phage tail lysozyme